MRLALSFFVALSTAAHAVEPDALSLLRQELDVEFISPREVRSCIVGWCDVYRTSTKDGERYLPQFMFLYTWHITGFGIRPWSRNNEPPFKETAAPHELRIRNSVAMFCADPSKDAKCILRGMRDKLGIVVSGGKYDEGSFNEGPVEDELRSNQPLHPDALTRAGERRRWTSKGRSR